MSDPLVEPPRCPVCRRVMRISGGGKSESGLVWVEYQCPRECPAPGRAGSWRVPEPEREP